MGFIISCFVTAGSLMAIWWLIKLVIEAPHHPTGKKIIRWSWFVFFVIVAGIVGFAFVDYDPMNYSTLDLMLQCALAPFVGLIVAGPFVLLGTAVCYWGQAEKERELHG